jgi:hypothetical protein
MKSPNVWRTEKDFISLVHQLQLLVSVNKNKRVYQITVFTIQIADIFIYKGAGIA